MKRKQGIHNQFLSYYQGQSPDVAILGAMIIVAGIAAAAVVLGLMASFIFNSEQMYIIRPLLATCSIFIIFSYVLWFRLRANIFGEIGLIYLALATAYTILPAVTFLIVDFDLPSSFDLLNFSTMSLQPPKLGMHFWRHVLFIFGVAAGYLTIRGGALPLKPVNENSTSRNGSIITVLIAIIGCCILFLTLLSSPVTAYIEHYTRFDNLSWSLRNFAYLCLTFKSGGYFVLLALMFSQYRKYRLRIFLIVLIFGTYELVYSFGSRIETLTILLAAVGFYHFTVAPISAKKGMVFLFALAVLFSGVEVIRSSNNSLEGVQNMEATKRIMSASEFGAVYNTGFHLYTERAQGTLPPRDWQMFFNDFISIIPFVDHTSYHPQFWYARNYFPQAVVPPQTMGVIADSAIWGGEFDLLLRSLFNGAIFAVLMRWFIQRREKWWALTVYIYCYATCILTLKYSVLYQLTPLVKIILPTLLLTGALFRLQKAKTYLKSFIIRPVA